VLAVRPRTDVGSTLRAELDLRKFAPEYRHDLLAWLLPVSPGKCLNMIVVHGLEGRPMARDNTRDAALDLTLIRAAGTRAIKSRLGSGRED
jgi:hypothetical protein